MCFMLAKANASWEKKAITFPEWGELKKKQGGGLPVVHLKDGTMLSESVPTAKYIAKMNGFYPEDPLLAHRCDYTVDAFTEACNALYDSVTAPEEKKEAAVGKVVSETFPKFLDKIEAGLGKMTWMAGEKLSLADFWVGAWYCDVVTNKNHPVVGPFAEMVKKYPNVCRWGEAFKAENKVWLCTRPDLPY